MLATVENSLPKESITMRFCQAPNAGAEANRIWEIGTASWGVDPIVEEIPQIDGHDEVDLPTAIRHSFGFIEMWGRKGGDSDVVACMSTYLLGFDGTDAQKQRLCGLEMVQRIVEDLDTKVVPYGPNKYVAFIETDLDEQTMLKRLLDAQTEPIGKYFPRFKTAQGQIRDLRNKELIDLSEGAERPFVDIFQGEVSALKRAYEDNGEHFFHWGYEEEEGDFLGINPDNKRQPLSELAEGATLPETGQMLKDLAEFFKGRKGKNRFALQLDFGEDAACCNTAFNAQQQTDIFGDSTMETASLASIGSNLPSISNISSPDGIYPQNDYCQKCKKNKFEEGCSCRDKDKPSD